MLTWTKSLNGQKKPTPNSTYKLCRVFWCCKFRWTFVHLVLRMAAQLVAAKRYGQPRDDRDRNLITFDYEKNTPPFNVAFRRYFLRADTHSKDKKRQG